MIKISGYVYIHVLTVVLFAVCWFTRRLEFFAVGYAVMLLHELAHLIAALLIGLKPSRIIFYPFGVNLRLKNKLIYSLADEIILYLSGPLMNILLAIVALLAGSTVFYFENIALFLINILPIMPLDGGVVVKKLIMHRFGYRNAERSMAIVSSILILALSGVGAYLCYCGHFNFSVCFFAAFLVGNLVCSREKYNIDFVRELMFYQKKGESFENRSIKAVMMRKGGDARELAKRFTIGSYYVIFIVDFCGKIDDIITETELMEQILGKSRDFL